MASTSSSTSTMPDIQAALRHLQSGQLPQAEQICLKILESQPKHPDALHFLGVIALHSGRLEAAIDAILKAIQVRPEDPGYHYNLALAYQRTNQPERAIATYRKAISLKPDWVEAIENLGTILARQGSVKDAINCFRQVLSIQPGRTETYNNLGVLYQREGLPDEALACHRKAFFLRPDDAVTQNHLANALKALGRLDEALAHYRGALALQPDFADACNNLGLALHQQGEHTEAIACYRKAISLDPRHANAYVCLGTSLQEQKLFEEALACYRKALELEPGFANARFNLSLLLLLLGDYAAGLEFYESRFDGGARESFGGSRQLMADLAPIPRWQGEPLQDKTLLVWTEQGLGDNIMMLRYFRGLMEAGPRRLIVYCDPALLRIIQALPGVSAVVSNKTPAPTETVDYHVPTMSLPFLFQTRLETIPNTLPYLTVPPERKAVWAERLSGLPGRKIGLTWAGGVKFGRDMLRSLQVAMLEPLMDVAGYKFVSLQKGAPAAQLPESNLPIHDWMDECDDLLDTAALIANLDLVISVDTSVAHLAAALGKPVWLLNRYESEWRWLLNRQDSPWYPGLRIFQQPAPFDWGSVIACIKRELASN